MFKRVLIANRGEIAIRIARAASELGLESVSVHASVDSLALHTRYTTETREIIGEGAIGAYLSIDEMLRVASETGCDCVHPGYGFLSENAIGRYALGSNSGLSANEEGEIVITFAAEKPDGVPQENWLPVPEDTFEVTLRMFGPGEDILDGTWSAPPITSR